MNIASNVLVGPSVNVVVNIPFLFSRPLKVTRDKDVPWERVVQRSESRTWRGDDEQEEKKDFSPHSDALTSTHTHNGLQSLLVKSDSHKIFWREKGKKKIFPFFFIWLVLGDDWCWCVAKGFSHSAVKRGRNVIRESGDTFPPFRYFSFCSSSDLPSPSPSTSSSMVQ